MLCEMDIYTTFLKYQEKQN